MKIQNFAWSAILTLSLYQLLGCGTYEFDNRFHSAPRANTMNSSEAHDDAERDYHPDYLNLATGRVEELQSRITSKIRARHAWPFAVLSIGHNNASYQNYGGKPYFHHGLDIRGDAGTAVIASNGGKVINIENYGPGPAYWEIAILDAEGFIWQYHHIDRQSIPQKIFDAKESGQPIIAGEKLGEIYYWPIVTFGERYHHVHLNVLGAGGVYLSPFDFLQPLNDTSSPKFVGVGLLKEDGTLLPGNTASGAYRIYATIHDLILHDQFVVPPHAISISIDQGAETNVWNFATLPGGASNSDYVESFFVPSLTCGDYECRKLTVDLGFIKNGHRNFPREKGRHSVKITAKDYAGNAATKDFSWMVK